MSAFLEVTSVSNLRILALGNFAFVSASIYSVPKPELPISRDPH